jgi:cytoplasmic tRNA 2-thiolation protein 2
VAVCSPVQPGLEQWKSRISIRSFDDQDENRTSSLSLVPHLCYACHTTLTSKSSRGVMPGTRSSPSPVFLPVWTESGLVASTTNEPISADEELWKGKVLNEEQMKSVIGDFLLRDPDDS